MKSHYRAVVIGGGVVGASCLYHLARHGWTDVALIERAELTAGSTWHAAAGFHPLNADPTVAALQAYTIDLYRQIEAESGISCGIHQTGGVIVTSDPDRWQSLKAAWAVFQSIGVESARLVTPEEAHAVAPIADMTGILGGLFDPIEGYLDPHGTTHAYAGAAQKRGADVILRNRVVELKRTAEGWELITEQGTIHAEHVVNCGGLWAKQVGLMAGVDLPVTPMEHHYLVTEDIPEVAALPQEMGTFVDMEGFTYMRQERQGMLLGFYELNPKHWNIEGAPWDYGMELIPEDLDRIEHEVTTGFARYPCLANAGIKRWVNGAFTFTSDGNPLVGPVPGMRNYWVACGVMAGFSQGGGVGKTLAEWMIQGEPEGDAFAMDIARYGAFAANREYLRQTTAQFYSRRFQMTYPNERLPAGRPLRRPGAYDGMTVAGARWMGLWGMEFPAYFAPDGFEEAPTLRRSNAFDLVGQEVRAVREAVGLLDISGFSRFRVSGRGARAWLDRLLACQLPGPGRVRLTPMLGHDGRLKGDLTVLNWSGGHVWLMGSYYLRAWHKRWFDDQLEDGIVVEDLSDTIAGFSLSGPNARAVIDAVAEAPVSLPFMGCGEMDLGMIRARVARLSVAGELGYEINCHASEHASLREMILQAGAAHGLREVGYYALDSLRLEKSFGRWSAEFTQAYTPAMTGLDRFIADKAGFIGHDAFRQAAPPPQVLVTLEVDADDADPAGFEPLYAVDAGSTVIPAQAGIADEAQTDPRLRGDDEQARGEASVKVGFTTSGGYGHWIGKSLALALIDPSYSAPGTELTTYIVGEERTARVIAPSPHDPAGARMRA